MMEEDKNKMPVGYWAQAEADGMDMSLLEANLGKTPEELLRQQCDALNAILKLREALARAND